MRHLITSFVAAAIASPIVLGAASIPFELPVLWPEAQRAFAQDGPGWLLDRDELDEFVNGDRVARERFIDAYLAHDPLPATPQNELVLGIAKRRQLMQLEFQSTIDVRARLLFVHGIPHERKLIDCVEVYKPLEVWAYPYGDAETPGIGDDGLYRIVVYRDKPGEPYRLWLPIDGKRALYNPEMEYFLDQWEEYKSRIVGRRPDRALCTEAEWLDRKITGVDGMFGFRPNRPRNEDMASFLEPPAELAAWAEQAAATALPATVAELPVGTLEVRFPEKQGQRLATHFTIVIPPEAELEPLVKGDLEELRLNIEGELLREGKVFETFRMRFLVPPPETPTPIALVAPRRLRPNEVFLARLKLVDEVSGAVKLFNHGFRVPVRPQETDEPTEVPPEAIVALGEQLRNQRVAGNDSLILIPPATDVTFGLWRAEALVTGARIKKVAFFLDGKQVFKRSRPPFSAELRLPTQPREQVVRVEGYDTADNLIAHDEVVLNQPRGQLQVRILEPVRGNRAEGTVAARAEIVVPEERAVSKVSFAVNEELLATLDKPPWETTIDVPPRFGQDLVYLTVTAELDDGSSAEQVRFLNAPDGIEEVDVNLVELYTTVVDRNGRLARGLTADQFTVREDGRPQTIAKFELVEDLPLTLGITIDTSGSMYRNMGEAQRTAKDFLENIITPRDLCFAVAFSDRPSLVMPRTSDVGAVAKQLEKLLAHGSTSLHDAVVTSLYYFRGIRGRRALVLLSDGEDTSSTITFGEAIEYAKLSGVAIYSVGLGIGATQVGVRRKLESLSEETGGRTFYIRQAEELRTVYKEIEEELRSQYLLAFSSDNTDDKDSYRTIEVEIDKRGLNARTIRGYYP